MDLVVVVVLFGNSTLICWFLRDGLVPGTKLFALLGGLDAAVIPIPFYWSYTVTWGVDCDPPVFCWVATGPKDWTLNCRVDGK